MVNLYVKRIKFLLHPTHKERDSFRDNCPYISQPFCHMPFFPSVLQFNFVGKLLGPRGNSMKRLQEETGVKMSILGKGSMRDKGKVRKISICVEIQFFGRSKMPIK